MNLAELLAAQERRLSELRAAQDAALTRTEQVIADETARSAPDPTPGAAAVDGALDRHAAMAQQVLRATAAYERRVLRTVAERAGAAAPPQARDVANPPPINPSGESP